MRPDQEKFDTFARPLSVFDSIFEEYATYNGFTFEKNAFRTPSRMLRKHDNPGFFIEMLLDSIWYDVDYSETLPYKFIVIADCKDDRNPEKLWRFEGTLASGRPVSWMLLNIRSLVEEAIRILNNCTSKFIEENGRQMDNLKNI
jgi:hypothetical protein